MRRGERRAIVIAEWWSRVGNKGSVSSLSSRTLDSLTAGSHFIPSLHSLL